MFSDNEKISLRQIRRLLVLDLFSISSLIIPRIATVAAGRDGIISIVVAALFALVYSWVLLSLSNHINGNLLEFCGQSAGRMITFLIGTLFIVKLFACCVFAARLFGDVIKQTLLEDTDHRIIILMLLMVSAYAASKGFEIRARIAELLFFIVITPILILLVLGLKDINITNLLPIFVEKPGDIVLGGYQIFLTFSMLELLLFTAPLISYSRSGYEKAIKKGKGLFAHVIQALCIVIVINFLFFLVTVGILGVEETRLKLWSSVTIMQIIKLPGDFIQRQDALILTFWMLSIFTIISGFLYYMCLISKKIFHVYFQKYHLIPFVIFLFAASAIPLETEQYYDYFEAYMMYIGMPQSILLPLLVVFLSKCKKNRINTSALKSIFVVLILSSSFALTACSDMTEIEDRNFVQTMGIDLHGSELTIYYQLPDLKALTKQSAEDPKKLIIQLKGIDFWEIEDKYHLQSNKQLDFSHLKAIVLGKSFAEDVDKLEEFLAYVENKYELGRNTLIFLSKTEAKDIMSMNGDLNGGVGNFLDRMYRINLLNTGSKEVTVGDMIQGVNNHNTIVQLPYLQANKKTVTTSGLGFFNQCFLAYHVDQEEADYIHLLNGSGKNNRLYFERNKSNKRNKTKIDNIEYVIKMDDVYRKMDFYWKNNKPYLNIFIDCKATIEKGITKQAILSKTENTQLIKEVEVLCEAQMEEKMNKLTEEIMKKEKIDFLNLYRMTSYKNRSMWLYYVDKEEDFIKDLNYTIQVNMNLE